MRSLSIVLLLSACQPTPVYVGERAFSTLQSAALHAQPGDTLSFDAGLELKAGVQLADDVTVQGPVTLWSDGLPAFTSDGLLTLSNVTLEGTGANGSLVDVGELVFDGSRITSVPSDGVAALNVAGPVTITDSELTVDGEILYARQLTGRPPVVDVATSALFGRLTLEADEVTLTDVTGAAHVDLNSPRPTLTDVEVSELTTRGGPVQLVGIVSTGPVVIENTHATLLDVAGGTWSVDVERLEGASINVDALAGHADELSLDTVSARFVQFDEADSIVVHNLNSDSLRLHGDVIVTEDLRAHRIELLGVGSHDRLTLLGEAPQLTAVTSTLTGVIAISSSQAVVLQLEGATIAGLLLLEPPGAALPYLVDTRSFASVRNVTMIGGSRSKTTPRFSQLFVYDSLFEMRNFGAVENDTHFVNTLAYGSDKALVPRNGLEVAQPDFLPPGGPEVVPTSPHARWGAFAGPTGPEMAERWATLP